jgi:dipeptidyl aminopeptidase/acylaminoacyl peptidase
MLIHGEQDSVPYTEAERMFMALQRLGRDAILLRYAGEGHVFASPANIRDSWQRTLDFLDAHLGRARAAQRPQ